jgi:hypothetical protein
MCATPTDAGDAVTNAASKAGLIVEGIAGIVKVQFKPWGMKPGDVRRL